jgi:filamentous hemagglutinin family protein
MGFVNIDLATAQSIQTDGTTSTQPTSCSGDCLIEGGLQQGDNLFHSFKEFNVDGNATVLFQDPGVANILSRVTGNQLSEILGTLGVSGGDANLFLLNPNGIIFGQNSSLDLNGSFLATTANSLRFGEQGLLAATSNAIPLLTINPSALVFAPGNQGTITNESSPPAGDNPENLETFGLRVPNGKSLLLVGGDVNINSGVLTALGGRIELGGLAEQGEVSLKIANNDPSNISLDFLGQSVRANVSLTNGTFINVFSLDDGGDIAINAQNITIADESSVVAGIDGNMTTADSQAGNITLDATDKIAIINVSSVANQVFSPTTKGNAGDININSDSLLISNSSFIDTSTLGQGNAGNIDISLTGDLVASSNSVILSEIFSGAIGNAGNITIEANNIFLDCGSQLVSNVLGQGTGGNISLNVFDSINITGFGTGELRLSSGIVTATDANATTGVAGRGDAGNVTVNTDSFRVADGGLVSSQTLNESDGGSISIDANNFAAIDGGQVVTSAASAGDAGDINIQAADRILLSGTEPNFVNRLAEFGDETLGNEAPGNSGFFANVRADASGAGGNIRVAAGQLDISDGAEIDVSAAGTGVAGSLSIDAQDITLDKGSLTAETRVGDLGNISLNNADTLLLRNNSQITTDASAAATGGNITISAQGIAALDNSDITAKAVRGQGGNIQITTQGIFSEPDSQITAASELGIDGTVTLNTPDVDPASGIYQLPDAPIDAENILAQDLCKLEDEKIAKGSSFIITGRGGLTPTAADSLGDVDNVVNWANREDLEVSQNGAVGIRQREANSSAKDSANTSYPNIQQSQGLVVAKDGSAWLTANAYSTASNNSGITHPDCRHK